MTTSTHELRAEARIPVTRRGNLSAGETWFPCMVLDMSNSGFLMMSNRHLAVGQILDFRCELYPEQVFDCKIEVLRFNEDGAGVKITEIDEKSARLFQLYILEKHAVTLEKKPKARLNPVTRGDR